MSGPSPARGTAPSAKHGVRTAPMWIRRLASYKLGLLVTGVLGVACALLYAVELSVLWKWLVGVASVGAVLSGLAGYWSTYHAVKALAPTAPAGPPATSAPRQALSIVVLPFANHTGEPAQAYFADGLTVSVTGDLLRLRGAYVISVTTAFSYKDKPVKLADIAKDLGVHFVLQGSVQRNGDKIRIHAQLADASTDQQLWSESFDGEAGDLFALQDQVTTRIGLSIGREMVVTAARESEARTNSPLVVDLLLRASAIELRPQSLERLKEIEGLYREALRLEPGNPSAMVGLACSLSLQATNYNTAIGPLQAEANYAAALELALQSKAIDPGNPTIYRVLGICFDYQGDLEAGQRAYENWLSLAPNRPGCYNSLALSHIRKGEPSKAVELLLKGYNLNPRHPGNIIPFNLGWAYFMLGDIDSALDWLRRSVDESPNYPNPHAYLAMCYALKGDTAKAGAEAAKALQIDPNFGLKSLSRIHPGTPQAFKDWREQQFMPAWRKAGLPI